MAGEDAFVDETAVDPWTDPLGNQIGNFPALSYDLNGGDLSPLWQSVDIYGNSTVADLSYGTSPALSAYGSSIQNDANNFMGQDWAKLTGLSQQTGQGAQELQQAQLQIMGVFRGPLAPLLTNTGFRQNSDGTWSAVNLTTGAPADSPTMDALKKVFKPIEDLLSTNFGKLAAAAGIGFGSLALARGLAGNVSQIKVPPPAAPNPIFQAGQGALLDALRAPGAGTTNTGQQSLSNAFGFGLSGQASLADLLASQAARQNLYNAEESPLARNIRMGAYGNIPQLMGPTAGVGQMTALGGQAGALASGIMNEGTAPLADPTLAGLNEQIQNVLSGKYSNVQLEQQIKLSHDAFTAKMYAQLGPGWETSTPGMQALEQQNLMENATRQQDLKSTLASYVPLAQGQRAFDYNQPIQSQATRLGTLMPIQQSGATFGENVRQQSLGQNVGLASMGSTSPTTLASNLSTLTPVPSLLNLPGAAAEQQQITSQNFQAAQANAANNNASNQSLASGIGSIGGVLAGGLLKGNRLTDAGSGSLSLGA